MKNFFSGIKIWVVKHKVISAIIVIVILGGGYWSYTKFFVGTPATQYVLGQVTKGTLISSIDGTGQVSATNQIDLKPKVSAKITSISVKAGQEVKQGAVIASLDAGDASKAVRDAELSLQSAQLSLAKQNQSLSQTDVRKAYDDGFNAVGNSFLDLPGMLTKLEDLVYNGKGYLSNNSINALGQVAQTYSQTAVASYFKTKKSYDQNLVDYKLTSRDSATSTIESLISETYNTIQDLSEAIKDANTLVDYLNTQYDTQNKPPQLMIDQSSLNTFTNTTNSHATALINSKSSIQSATDAVGNNGLDTQSSELTVAVRQNALNDAREKLADYTIRAPFSGIIGNVVASLSDDVGPSSVIATLVTKQKIAVIQLNEVDEAKIALGNKATLTFDALPDLSLTGTVEEIENVGVLSQGVVTYNIKITFDTQDDRVKPTMTVSASIITDSKEGVLMVPSSAVKTDANGGKYVQEIAGASAGAGNVSTKTAPQSVAVEVGNSNDTDTEIVSGLNEGDTIVIRSIASSATTAVASAPSLFGGSTGGNRGGTTGATTRALRSN